MKESHKMLKWEWDRGRKGRRGAYIMYVEDKTRRNITAVRKVCREDMKGITRINQTPVLGMQRHPFDSVSHFM